HARVGGHRDRAGAPGDDPGALALRHPREPSTGSRSSPASGAPRVTPERLGQRLDRRAPAPTVRTQGVHFHVKVAPALPIPRFMAKNPAAIVVGRLLEIRADAGYRTTADVDELFDKADAEVAKLPSHQRLVTVADWRRCPVMASQASDRILERIM